MRRLNLSSVQLIKGFEGFLPTPYKDSVGIATIGFGTIHYPNGKAVTMSDPPVTKEQAEEYLTYEIEEKSRVVDAFLNSIGLQLTDNQYGALVSFAYNLGTGPIVNSGKTMNVALRSKNLAAIADAFLPYCKGTFLGIKKVIPGLEKRRKLEREFFLKG